MLFWKKSVFAFICLGLILLCSGCSGKKTKEIELVTEKLNQIFTVSSQQKKISEENSGARVERLIFENVSYTVIEATDSSYTIMVQAPNMTLLFDGLYNETQYLNLSIDEYNIVTEQLLSDIEKSLLDKRFEVKETTLTLPLENGEIVLTEELVNAFYGGLLDTAQELSNHYLENDK